MISSIQSYIKQTALTKRLVYDWVHDIYSGMDIVMIDTV